MVLLRRLFRGQSGQTATEYMLVVSVVSVAAMFALAYLGDPNAPPQQAGAKLTNNFSRNLTNNGGGGSDQSVR